MDLWPFQSCPRCFHNIGEHYLCRDHGGESGFMDAAYRLPQKMQDSPPDGADYNHPWFDFLNYGERVLKEAIP